MDASNKPRVGLFVTCLVDLFRPSIGWAAVKLLEDAGCLVEVPLQTCCGQPAYNSGDRKLAQELARLVIEAFTPYDYIVAPSGSCAGMLAKHYSTLFDDDAELSAKAEVFAKKVHELSDFLVTILKVTAIDTDFPRQVTYHDACSGLRELGIADQPRQLLASVRGLNLIEMDDHTRCCGFGGTFAVKYGDVSAAIADEKADAAEKSGAPVLLAGDLGCLMNIAGRLSRRGSTIEVRHFAEVLAGMADGPAICAAKRR